MRQGLSTISKKKGISAGFLSFSMHDLSSIFWVILAGNPLKKFQHHFFKYPHYGSNLPIVK